MIIQILKGILVAIVFSYAAFGLISFFYDRFFNKKLMELRKVGYDLETGWKMKRIKEKEKNG